MDALGDAWKSVSSALIWAGAALFAVVVVGGYWLSTRPSELERGDPHGFVACQKYDEIDGTGFTPEQRLPIGRAASESSDPAIRAAASDIGLNAAGQTRYSFIEDRLRPACVAAGYRFGN